MFPLKLHLKKIEAQGSNIALVGRDEKGRRFTVQCTFFRPYFYVGKTEENLAILEKRGLEFEDGPLSLDDHETVRVYTKLPGDVGKRRRGFKMSYESNVPYTRRFLVDMGIKDGFIVKAARKLAADMLIVGRREDIEAVDYRNPDRIFHYDIETNKPEGSNHYSPPVIAKGAVTCKTLHDTYDGTNFHTFLWHPHRGVKGKPKLEVRNRFSKTFKRNVDWYVHWHGSEHEMFESMLKFQRERRPDALNAWNGHRGFKKIKNGFGFDFPYLVNRCKQIGINPGMWSPMGNAFANFQRFGKEAKAGKFAAYCDGVQLLDMMTNYQIKDGGFVAAVPYSDLKRVVKDKLGYDMNKEVRKDLTRWWLDDVDEFLDYSFDDVDAIVGLEKKEGYCEWTRGIQQFVGAEDANKLFTPMSLISTLNLRIARDEMKRVVPSAIKKDDAGENQSEEDDYTAEGGFVLPPRKTGVQDTVAILDATAMYVNIIRSCNISWETWVPNPTDEQLKDLIAVPSDLGTQFFLKPSIKVGLMSKTCDYLMTFRKIYDDQIKLEKDAAKIEALKKARDPAKQLVLAVFGTSLSDFFDLWRQEAGSSITGMGRYIITGIDAFLQREHERFMTYGDTDSEFIPLKRKKLDEKMVKEGLDLCDAINEQFTEMFSDLNIDKHSLKIGMEKILHPFVQGKQKKQYAGMIVWSEGKWQEKPKMLVKGVPGIKSDATQVTQDVTETVLHMILTRQPLMEVVEYVRDVYESVLRGQVPIDDIVKAVTLGTHPDDDLPKPNYIHTAARNGQALKDYSYNAGQKVSILNLKGAEGQKIAIPEGEDIPLDLPIDLDHHANQAVLEPIRGIMSWVDLDEMLDSIRVGTELTRTMVLE